MHMRPLALPLLLIPGAASADVTPQDVWDNMVAGYGAFGLETTAALETSGDTLIANDGLVTLTYPVIGGQMTVTLPPMTLTAQGDGTVQIVTPATFVSTVLADIPEEDGQMSVDITIAQEGLSHVASGNPGDVTYVSETSSYDGLITNLVIPGETPQAFEISLDTDGYASDTRVTVAENVTVTVDTTNRASVMTMNIDADGFRQETNTTSGALRTAFRAVIPPATDIMNLAPALRGGLSITGETEAEGGETATLSYNGDELFSEQTQVTGASNGTFGFDADGIRFEGTGAGGSFGMTSDEVFPFPVDLSFGDVSAKIALPLLAGDDPQGFGYGISVSDLAVADEIWDIIDAGKVLDRSPVAVSLDIAGEMTLTGDLVDPATFEAMDQGVVPVAPNSVTINDLGIGALGAVIAASGAFVFDNDDLVTFGGLPRPEGSAKASATGLNAAIDQLVAAGLIGEQDVAMPRMFMGMFAVSEGDDALSTEVEINAEGHVILNGQRIQ